MNLKSFLEELPSSIEQRSPKTYADNTLGLKQTPLAALRVSSKDEISAILLLAKKHKVRLHPISTGKNWGYGSALSSDSDAIVLDLSRLNKIKFNPIDETFTVEPGVTQADLFQFLTEKGLPYLTPITGAGPNVSILANALERGFGITPIEEHFSSVMAIKAIMPDGSDYQPIMFEKTGSQLWKWDIGPYVQGLFSQSSIGIVYEMAIKLYPMPEVIGIFKCESQDLQALAKAAKEARGIELVKGINIMNGPRISGMTGAKKNLNDWTLIGSFYCRKELLAGIQKVIKIIFKKHGLRVTIANTRSFKYLAPLIKKVSKAQYNLANGFFDALKGVPTTLALNLVGGESNANQQGLIWYSPMVPNNSDILIKTTNFIVKTCEKYSINPLITYTLVNTNVFDATIPILFSKDDQFEPAWACYDDLLESGLKIGIMPYRYPINRMNIVHGTFADQINCLLKGAFDPNHILSGGKYVSS
jgi:hypothetical protein